MNIGSGAQTGSPGSRSPCTAFISGFYAKRWNSIRNIGKGFVFSNIGRGGEGIAREADPCIYATGSLGKGFKRQRHKVCGKRCLDLCLVAEPEHHSVSTTGSYLAPSPLLGASESTFSGAHSALGISPVLKQQ